MGRAAEAAEGTEEISVSDGSTWKRGRVGAFLNEGGRRSRGFVMAGYCFLLTAITRAAGLAKALALAGDSPPRAMAPGWLETLGVITLGVEPRAVGLLNKVADGVGLATILLVVVAWAEVGERSGPV